MQRLSNALFVFVALLALQGTACGTSAEQADVASAPPAGAASQAAAAAPDQADQSDQKAPGSQAPAADAELGRGPVVARVNDTPIYQRDYELAMSSFMRNNGIGPDVPEDKLAELRKVVLDGLIGSELLYQKARSIPITVPEQEVSRVVTETRSRMGEETFAAEMKNRGMSEQDITNLARQNLVVQKMIQEVILGPLTISEDDIKKFYDEHPEDMQRPEGVDASHILVKSAASDPPDKRAAARGRIEEAQKRIKAGEEFGTVAKEVSEDSSASGGGALGMILRGQTVPAFENAAFQLAVNQVSDIVETQFGFHIIKVTGKHESGKAPIADVHDQIAEYLKQTKSREAIESMVTSLRAAAKVEIL